uniref:Uncharacterized protein n=1 Tax=Setaria italica TaxID=4555 RepID=K3YFJ5_SETIT
MSLPITNQGSRLQVRSQALASGPVAAHHMWTLGLTKG